MVREDRKAWERLEAVAADEAYMQELRRQHPELVKAEQAIFADAEGGEVIALSSDDEVEGGEDGGKEGGEVIALSSDDEVEGGDDGGAEGVEVGPEDEEINVDESRSALASVEPAFWLNLRCLVMQNYLCLCLNACSFD